MFGIYLAVHEFEVLRILSHDVSEYFQSTIFMDKHHSLSALVVDRRLGNFLTKSVLRS